MDTIPAFLLSDNEKNDIPLKTLLSPLHTPHRSVHLPCILTPEQYPVHTNDTSHRQNRLRSMIGYLHYKIHCQIKNHNESINNYQHQSEAYQDPLLYVPIQ